MTSLVLSEAATHLDNQTSEHLNTWNKSGSQIAPLHTSGKKSEMVELIACRLNKSD